MFPVPGRIEELEVFATPLPPPRKQAKEEPSGSPSQSGLSGSMSGPLRTVSSLPGPSERR